MSPCTGGGVHSGYYVCSVCGYKLFNTRSLPQTKKLNFETCLKQAWSNLLPKVGDLFQVDAVKRSLSDCQSQGMPSAGVELRFKISCGKCENPLGEEYSKVSGSKNYHYKFLTGSLKFVSVKP